MKPSDFTPNEQTLFALKGAAKAIVKAVKENSEFTSQQQCLELFAKQLGYSTYGALKNAVEPSEVSASAPSSFFVDSLPEEGYPRGVSVSYDIRIQANPDNVAKNVHVFFTPKTIKSLVDSYAFLKTRPSVGWVCVRGALCADNRFQPLVIRVFANGLFTIEGTTVANAFGFWTLPCDAGHMPLSIETIVSLSQGIHSSTFENDSVLLAVSTRISEDSRDDVVAVITDSFNGISSNATRLATFLHYFSGESGWFDWNDATKAIESASDDELEPSTFWENSFDHIRQDLKHDLVYASPYFLGGLPKSKNTA